MKFSIFLGLFILLAFSMTVFADAPTFDTGWLDTNTPDRLYTDDLNYFDVPITLLSGVVSDVDDDLLVAPCQYSDDGGNTFSSADFNTDTNRCWITLETVGHGDDFNFQFMVEDDAMNQTTTDTNVMYYDETSPLTLATAAQGIGSTTITFNSTDSGTTIGASGVERIWYSVDGDTWTSTTDNPGSVVVTGAGNHTIYFYGMDNLDNNEMVGYGLWEKPFAVTGIPNNVCNLTNILLLVLVAAAVVGILGLAYTGNLNITTVSAMTISILTFLVILYISGVVNSAMCVI